MTALLDGAGFVLICFGILFLLAAATGLWRLPDLCSRLHALTKADTAGVALIALGTGLLERDAQVSITLGLIVLLVAISGATAGHLIARAEFGRMEEEK